MKILHYEKKKQLIEGKKIRKWKTYHWRLKTLNSRLDPAGKRISEVEDRADKIVQNMGGKGKVMR